MKSFLEHIKEEVLPSVQVSDGGLDIEKPAVRAAINAAIAGVVSQPAVTPYVVYNRLSKLLAQYHIALPRKFLEGDKGVEVFEVKQFGLKMGMTDSGEFVNEVPTTHYLFIQYGIITPMGVTYAKPLVGGMFRVTARLVDKIELDRLLDMAEITLGLHEDAECRQNSAKASAPKDPMHDITSDTKKVGNKKAVGTSEKKSIDEELSHGARELTLHADNDRQLHRSSHEPIIKNLQRKHAKGAYDHEKATKLWGYHAKRASDSYHKEHGHKFSTGERREAAKHFADSARDEHGFGSVKEEQIDELFDTEKGRATQKSYLKKAVASKHRAQESKQKWREREMWRGYLKPGEEKAGDKATRKHDNRTKGIYRAIDRLEEDEQLDETRMPASVIKHKQRIANMTPEEKAKKFAGKSPEQLKDMARRHGFGKDSNEYSKTVKEEQIDEKAPPGANYERMVQHIKDKFSKDGLTKKEKSIAFATAWKAKNREKGE